MISATTQPPSSSRLTALLEACVGTEASDLHLAPGMPPLLRIHGVLQAIDGEVILTAQDLDSIAAQLSISAPDGANRGSIDGAITGPNQTRFRYNLFRRQGELAVAFRRLEDTFRTLAQLGLPQSLDSLCDLRDGLVVIAGPTGAGKSTTLGTLLDRVNRTRACHMVTIEDPIEYLHRPAKALVNQRQVGTDAPSFNDALVASLRQDPDVILVGEIRDLATIRTAITASETGHLVFTTIHAGDCVGAVERLTSVFPADEQDGIRRQLGLVLRTIVAQHLLPSAAAAEGRAERVVASEILNVTPAVANLIALGKSSQIYSCMESGMAQGMQTLEQDLARLWVAGRISEASGVAFARHVNVFRDRAALMRRKVREA